MRLLDKMREAINTDPSSKILFILHTYGSHFSYHQRYPREFARFMPDDDVAISRKNLRMIRNAYDNTTLYTDYFLNEVIRELEQYPDLCSAMFYCSDHGEDLFDNGNGRFLHASPTITYHQVHVAALAWFSKAYEMSFGEKVAASLANIDAPATTYSVFHTIADIASISSPYLDVKASLVNASFDYDAPRLYLNDHNEAVVLDKEIGIDESEKELFDRAGVRL
jgi:lipid A ethanolaminephosphotransferase